MRIITKNRIFKDERYWELISGPWTVAEDWLMQQHIHDFKRSGIDCITQKGDNDDHLYVYRCAKGYVNLNTKQYDYTADFKYKHKHSEFRELQKERQKDIQRSLCVK